MAALLRKIAKRATKYCQARSWATAVLGGKLTFGRRAPATRAGWKRSTLDPGRAVNWARATAAYAPRSWPPHHSRSSSNARGGDPSAAGDRFRRRQAGPGCHAAMLEASCNPCERRGRLASAQLLAEHGALSDLRCDARHRVRRAALSWVECGMEQENALVVQIVGLPTGSG